jgi:hypothetical protein
MGGDVYRRFYAAAVQAAPVFLDRDASISRLEQWVARAKATGANGWRGFIDGAIEQGSEAGRRVRALLT